MDAWAEALFLLALTSDKAIAESGNPKFDTVEKIYREEVNQHAKLFRFK
jgi:DNA-binding phage protein